MQQIAKRVYFESAYLGGNVGCILTDRGPILIDTPPLPREARHWRDQIAQLTDLPVQYVVNTDYTTRRSLTNALFDAPVVAHEMAWQRASEQGHSLRDEAVEWLETIDPEAAAEMRELPLAWPEITFTERMSLEKGQPVVRLLHLGGHSPATIGVYLSEERVLFAGDNVVLDTLPVLTEADSKQWLRALTYIRKMHIEILVPGHGPLCDTEATQPLSAYIRLVRDRVRRHYQAGRSKSEMTGLFSEIEEAYRIPKGKREDLRARIKANLDRVYDEMKARYRKKP
jgi:cyclase